MPEYIERRALMVALCEEIVGDGDYYSGKDAMQDQIRDMVSQFPQADVVPVVHGHWIWHEEEFEYECSACHCRFDYNHTFEIFDHGFQYANYCPKCGAKMNGGADND